MKPRIHPGLIISDELEEWGISLGYLARTTEFSLDEWQEVLDGKRPLNQQMNSDLAYFFGTSPEFWRNVQQSYNIEKEDLQNE